MKKLLVNRMFFPDSVLLDENGEPVKDGNYKVYPSGRVLIQIERKPFDTGDLRATLKLGGTKTWLKMMLPAGHFNINDPNSWVSRMKAFFDPLYPISEFVVNIPVKLSDNQEYFYCDRSMFSEYEHACRLMPNWVFDYKKNGNAGIFDGVSAKSAKTKVNAFGIYHKGKSVVDAPLPKKPFFLDRDFGSGKEAVLELMRDRLEGPLYYNQRMVMPKLSKFNFHMTLQGLLGYFDKIETRLKLNGNFDFQSQGYINPEIQEIYRALTAPKEEVEADDFDVEA